MTSRLTAIYHVRSDARSIEARAQAIAVEQSVEMPLSAIEDQHILDEIVGKVEDISEIAPGLFAVRIGLAAATAGHDRRPAHQHAVRQYVAAGRRDPARRRVSRRRSSRHYGGPNIGLAGLRERAGAAGRALTCSALKPQGLPPARLAELAARFARGGIDYIKDDHGLADQAYSPFAARLEAIADALRAVERETGRRTRYVPSLTGDLDALRAQIAAAQRGRHRHRDGAADDHAACRISRSWRAKIPGSRSSRIRRSRARRASHPALLFGKIFRMLGADAVVFPNHGGRFGYYAGDLPAHRRNGAAPTGMDCKAAVPVPAGGMTTERVGEMLDFYGCGRHVADRRRAA